MFFQQNYIWFSCRVQPLAENLSRDLFFARQIPLKSQTVQRLNTARDFHIEKESNSVLTLHHALVDPRGVVGVRQPMV